MAQQMSKIFGLLMGFMRQRGTNQEDGEFRILWLAITVVYMAITFEILGGAFKVWSRRTWRRFFDYDKRKARRTAIAGHRPTRVTRAAA